MSRLPFFAALTVATLAACVPAPAFSDLVDAGTRTEPGDATRDGAGREDAGLDFDPELDGSLDPDNACASEGAEATLTRTPADIILLVDNSASMRPQIERVQATINADFAAILDEYKLDYRLIVISSHGDVRNSEHAPICIEAPLSGIPAGGCTPSPEKPVNTARFFHYAARIRKNDAGQILVASFDKADSLGLAPNGWSEWLRDGAFKSILVMTDGRVQFTLDGELYDDGNAPNHAVTLAAKLDEKLRLLSPVHFGEREGAPNHRWYSIVGLAPNEPPSDPYPPSADFVTETCAAGTANAGLGYQALSKLTGGPRFPVCNPGAFDVIFRAIAKDLVHGSPVACEFPIPAPPPGETLDLERVAVRYTPSDSSAPVLFGPVDDASDCAPNAFYLESDTVHLCPDACSLVQSDDGAKVGVLFDCEVIVR